MAVAFDTDALEPADRMDAVVAMFVEASAPAYVTREDDDADPRVRMDVWDYGSTCLFRGEMGGIRLRRTATHIARAPANVLAIAVQESGTARHEQFDRQRVIASGDLLISDLNTPYDYLFTDNGACRSLHIPLDRLDLPHEVVAAVAADPGSSPLYATLAAQIAANTALGGRLGHASAKQLGNASIELARAFFVTACGDERLVRDALATTLLTRIHLYIKQHLRDTDLSAEKIAVAHNISVRYLYKLTAGAELSLSQWITSQRLQSARDELADPASAYRSIAMIARTWGFTNPAHFSRRFHDAYGITPTEWRRLEY